MERPDLAAPRDEHQGPAVERDSHRRITAVNDAGLGEFVHRLFQGQRVELGDFVALPRAEIEVAVGDEWRAAVAVSPVSPQHDPHSVARDMPATANGGLEYRGWCPLRLISMTSPVAGSSTSPWLVIASGPSKAAASKTAISERPADSSITG